MTVYSADWVLPVEDAPIQGGGVQVEDGWIVAVGPAEQLEGEREHFPGCVIAPGLVNAHTHLEYAAYAGFGDGRPFESWLAVHIERKRRLTWEDTVAIAAAGAAECLASGVTTVADASFSGAAALAAHELGLRAIVYLEVFGADASELETRFAPNRARIEHALSDRVRLGVSPHAPYTAGVELYEACLRLGLPVATHLAESQAERACPSIRELATAGLLRPGLTAAHCVTVDQEEIALLARHDVGVVHCPRSNALLGCGTAPLRALLDAGIRVGLGTDSPASTPSFDLFDELRAALMLARAREARADALTPAEVLRLATLGAAEAIGVDHEVGSLRPGKQADLCVVDLAGSPFEPVEDPATALVLGGAPERVCRTIVGGMTAYARGDAAWRELRRSAAAARGRMLGRADSR